MLQGRIRVLLLILADAVTIMVSWVASVLGYRALGFGHYAFGAEFYWKMWPVAVAFVLVNVLFQLYHRSVWYPAAPVNPVEELRRLVGSAVIVHFGALAALALAYQSTEHYSRAVIVISGFVTAVLAQPMRNLVRGILLKVRLGQIPVIVAGDGELAERVSHAIANDAYLGFRIVRRLGGDWNSLVSMAREMNIRVLVVNQDIRLFGCQMSELTQWFTHIEYVPTGGAFPVFGSQAVSFDGIGGLEMVNQRCMLSVQREKWLLDKVLAVLAFVILLPFFAVVPILVKLSSRGPVFYRQDRLGRSGRRIRVWKFRSMYADADARLRTILEADGAKRAEWEANFKLAEDPRVTPLGRFLRKTSIDEFPQLFNVFMGDMALVGPRPIVEREVPLYGAAYETFASVKPGITGLWQTSGRSDTDYARRIALDVYYVLNWSPWMDVWILFRTVAAVLFMRGAC